VLPQAFARLLAEQSKGAASLLTARFIDMDKDATIFFKRLEKPDYRGLVLFNRERWAGAEAELIRILNTARGKREIPAPPHRMMGADNLNPIEVT
jgi:hypothetical protein